jgi:hypothetical protein
MFKCSESKPLINALTIFLDGWYLCIIIQLIYFFPSISFFKKGESNIAILIHTISSGFLRIISIYNEPADWGGNRFDLHVIVFQLN